MGSVVQVGASGEGPFELAQFSGNNSNNSAERCQLTLRPLLFPLSQLRIAESAELEGQRWWRRQQVEMKPRRRQDGRLGESTFRAPICIVGRRWTAARGFN